MKYTIFLILIGVALTTYGLYRSHQIIKEKRYKLEFYNFTNGYDNVAFGSYVMKSNLSHHITVVDPSVIKLKRPHHVTAIGPYAAFTNLYWSYVICLGANSEPTDDNQIVITFEDNSVFRMSLPKDYWNKAIKWNIDSNDSNKVVSGRVTD